MSRRTRRAAASATSSQFSSTARALLPARVLYEYRYREACGWCLKQNSKRWPPSSHKGSIREVCSELEGKDRALESNTRTRNATDCISKRRIVLFLLESIHVTHISVRVKQVHNDPLLLCRTIATQTFSFRLVRFDP